MHKFSALCDGRYYEIPKNQRGFSWTSRQISDLFNDLTLAAQTSHYMGPVIVSRDTAVADFQDDDLNTVAKFILEDGQQRLTTMFIIANVIKRRLEWINNGPDVDSRELERLLCYRRGVNKFRLQNANAAFDRFFSDLLFDVTPAQIPSTPPMRDLKAAYSYVDDFFRNRDQAFLLDWKRKISNQAKFIWVDLATEGVNRYLAFDAINSRGLPLTEFDKIKNFCILVDEVRNLNEAPEDQWYDAITHLESFGVASLEDSFIAELFAVYHDTPVGQSDVHKAFVDKYRPLLTGSDAALEGDLQAFIRLWPSYARSFAFVSSKNRRNHYGSLCTQDAGGWLDRLDNMDLPTITRPLLASSQLRMSPNDFEAVARFCEIYTFRVYSVMRFRKDKNSVGIIRLASAVLRINKGIQHLVTKICDWLADMAPMKKVIEVLANGEPKYYYDPTIRGWPYCYYFLYEYEVAFSPLGVAPLPWGNRQDQKINSIEHILPQQHRDQGWWETEWPDEAKADKMKHTFGNLVLTAGNAALGRKSIADKISNPSSSYSFSHANATNTEKRIVQFTSGTEWKASNILKREFEMLTFAATRWGIPCCRDNGIITLDERYREIGETEIKVAQANCFGDQFLDEIDEPIRATLDEEDDDSNTF